MYINRCEHTVASDTMERMRCIHVLCTHIDVCVNLIVLYSYLASQNTSINYKLGALGLSSWSLFSVADVFLCWGAAVVFVPLSSYTGLGAEY